MRPRIENGSYAVFHGDCIEVMRKLPAESVHAVVTDPPYLLGFMGRQWDTRAAHEHLEWHGAWAAEAMRVLKPGGHLLAFGGTRTWHRLAVAIEDAGFEIRDSIAWLYGSGFPKSLDVSKAIDKAAGAVRTVTSTERVRDIRNGHGRELGEGINAGARSGPVYMQRDITAPATPEAQEWAGWGTALKPAFEPIVLARKPLIGTVAANVLEHGAGALNIDGCRIAHASQADLLESTQKNRHADFGTQPGQNEIYGDYSMVPTRNYDGSAGRWPANVVLDEHTAALVDAQSGNGVSRKGKPRGSAQPGEGWGMTATGAEYDDTGGASRFFYQAKAGSKERPKVDGVSHPTVKPLALMRWLVRMVTPPGGVVLDPFAGSGTTIEAAVAEGMRCIAIEREAEYLPLIEARLG